MSSCLKDNGRCGDGMFCTYSYVISTIFLKIFDSGAWMPRNKGLPPGRAAPMFRAIISPTQNPISCVLSSIARRIWCNGYARGLCSAVPVALGVEETREVGWSGSITDWRAFNLPELSGQCTVCTSYFPKLIFLGMPDQNCVPDVWDLMRQLTDLFLHVY